MAGRVQGMNFVAGAMLLFMGEEDAFWCLCAIVEDLLPGYFALDLIAPQVDQLVFKHLVRRSSLPPLRTWITLISAACYTHPIPTLPGAIDDEIIEQLCQHSASSTVCSATGW